MPDSNIANTQKTTSAPAAIVSAKPVVLSALRP